MKTQCKAELAMSGLPYMAELGIAMEKRFRCFLKKFYSPFHWTSLYSSQAIRDRPTHGTCIPCMGLGTYRGLRLPYVHAQCMPINRIFMVTYTSENFPVKIFMYLTLLRNYCRANIIYSYA